MAFILYLPFRVAAGWKSSGLEGYVEQVVSIADVGAWKPRPEVYRQAAGVAGCNRGRKTGSPA